MSVFKWPSSVINTCKSFFLYILLRFEVHGKCTFKTVKYASFSQRNYLCSLQYQRLAFITITFALELYKGSRFSCAVNELTALFWGEKPLSPLIADEVVMCSDKILILFVLSCFVFASDIMLLLFFANFNSYINNYSNDKTTLFRNYA